MPLLTLPLEVTLAAPTWLELRNAAGTFLRLLPLAGNVRMRQKINSLDVITFTYPREDAGFDDIDEGALVRYGGEDYRVVDVDDARSGTGLSVQITAEQHFIKLGDTLLRSLVLVDSTASAAVTAIISGTGWTCGPVTVNGKASLSAQWVSPLAALFNAANIWNGELYFDSQNKVVYLTAQRGANNNASFIYRKNIVGISRKRSAGKLFNRVYFEGKNGLTSSSGYVEDALSIATYGRRDFFWSDSTITSLATLAYGATLRLNAYRNPRTTYSGDVWNFEPVAGGTSWVTADLGDTVKIYDEDLDINVTTRVYEREWSPLDPTIPDKVVLSSDREWFPDLSEKLADLTNPTQDAIPDTNPCFGEGLYNWIDANNVPATWQGDGKPHISSAQWSGIDPVLSAGVWYTGYDTNADGLPDTGPRGANTDGTWENATYEPRGLDLDGDGIEDFWPFGEPMSYGVAGGHCYDTTEVPSVWDYANGGQPYLAADFLPAALIYDMTGIDYWGYDQNGNGVADQLYAIATMPQPFYFDRAADRVVLGVDAGGGLITWSAFNPGFVPTFHTGSSLTGVYCTGWTEDGVKNFSGPVGYDTNADLAIESWSPAGIDTNDDGKADLWPYGAWTNGGDAGWYTFGVNAYVGTCGAAPNSIAPISPDLPPPTGTEDTWTSLIGVGVYTDEAAHQLLLHPSATIGPGEWFAMKVGFTNVDPHGVTIAWHTDDGTGTIVASGTTFVAQGESTSVSAGYFDYTGVGWQPELHFTGTGTTPNYTVCVWWTTNIV